MYRINNTKSVPLDWIMRMIILPVAFLAILFAPMRSSAVAKEINVLTYRNPDLLAPLIRAFTEKTGIDVNIIFAEQGLEERVQAEGDHAQGDVILSTDVEKLIKAKSMGITQSINSDYVDGVIPPGLHDSEKHWYALTMRGRVLYVSDDRVGDMTLSYADLADSKWRGRICTRSGQHAYNIGLFSALLAHWGEEKFSQWLAELRDNLSQAPSGNDRAQAKAVYYGACDIAIGNTYYVGLMQTNERDPEQKDWAKAIHVVFPTIDEEKTHVNISGITLLKHAPNKDEALSFIEFLASEEGQAMYASAVFEYPANNKVAASELVRSWGEFQPDDLPLETVARYRSEASRIVDIVNFDKGPR